MLNLPTDQALQLWESAIKSTKNGITIVDAQSKHLPVIFANQTFEKQTGYHSSEIIGKNLRFLHRDDIHQPGLEELRQAISEKRYCNVVVRNYRKDGSLFWNELFISPVLNSTGEVTHFIGIQNYVTDRKLVEEEVRILNLELEQRVKERTAQLEEANRVLALEIARREQLEIDLRNSLAKEHELGVLRSRFISMVSHEFRTPLSIMLLYTEMLEYDGQYWPQEKRSESLQNIREMISHLNTMLDDILTVGKVEAGGLQFHPIPHDLTSTCEGVLSDIMHSCPNPHNICFTNTFEPKLVMVDEKLLRHILINLLSNAQKYTKDGSPISLSLSNRADKIVLEVKDRGIGIPEEDQSRIFEAFHRGTNVLHIPGTGLGLTIVQKSVESHGGEITFNSTPNEGTTFTVTLPLVLCPEGTYVAT